MYKVICLIPATVSNFWVDTVYQITSLDASNMTPNQSIPQIKKIKNNLHHMTNGQSLFLVIRISLV